MKQPEHEYWGLMAITWDLLRGDTSTWEDRLFYRRMIDEFGQPVLDVGCSTGRLLLDYLSDGIDVDGVDVSPEMLALCEDKARKLGLNPSLFQQSMESLDLPRKYRTIIVPSSSFQLITEVEGAKAAMNCFAQHLDQGGALVMPFMIDWKKGDPRDTGWRLTGEKARPEDGAVVQRWSRSIYDVDHQLEHTEDRYDLSIEGELITTEYHQRSPAVRWYTQDQARTLYKDAGFIDIRMYKRFTDQPASHDDPIFTLVGVRSL